MTSPLALEVEPIDERERMRAMLPGVPTCSSPEKLLPQEHGSTRTRVRQTKTDRVEQGNENPFPRDFHRMM